MINDSIAPIYSKEIRGSQRVAISGESGASVDTLLVQVAERQCRQSFQRLFQVVSKKIYHYALKNQLTEFQAKDLVQDTMTTVWQKARLFNPERGNAMAWIYTIARNIRFDALRKQQTQGVSISADDIWDVFSSEQTVSVDDTEEQSVFKNQMANYIAQLPKGQREVIEAVYVEGLTHQEFADMHALPLGTVKSRIRLALIKLSEWVN